MTSVPKISQVIPPVATQALTERRVGLEHGAQPVTAPVDTTAAKAVSETQPSVMPIAYLVYYPAYYPAYDPQSKVADGNGMVAVRNRGSANKG